MRRLVRPKASADPARWNRDSVRQWLEAEPELMSLELLRRARLEEYSGGKRALCEMVTSLRPERPRLPVRCEGLPGEFDQHGFGHVDIGFLSGCHQYP